MAMTLSRLNRTFQIALWWYELYGDIAPNLDKHHFDGRGDRDALADIIREHRERDRNWRLTQTRPDTQAIITRTLHKKGSRCHN